MDNEVKQALRDAASTRTRMDRMADDKCDPPITEPGFLGGVRVVNIGDVRVARGLSRRARSSCPHNQMIYDQTERRVWCKDCETDVEAFDAFKLIVEQHSRACDHIEKRHKDLVEAEAHSLRTLAAKNIDKAWQRRSMVPCCPHCSMGLFPEDFKNGIRGMMSREYAEAMAKRRNANKPPRP